MEVIGSHLAVSILSLAMRTSMCTQLMGGGTSVTDMCAGLSSYLNAFARVGSAVRPIVTLKSDIIDVSTNYSTEGKWKLK